jgi:hypothetical protein
MVTSPPVTVRAVACALTLTPSSRLSRASFRACLAQRHRRRRRPARCSGKQAVVEEETPSSQEAKNGEGDEGRAVQGWFSLDTIGLDILSIALPAALALAADPIAALVDTAFVGHLGEAKLSSFPQFLPLWGLMLQMETFDSSFLCFPSFVNEHSLIFKLNTRNFSVIRFGRTCCCWCINFSVQFGVKAV